MTPVLPNSGEARLKGYCPMGCGETLFVGSGGHITCSYPECKNPTAVDDILGDGETEHIVTLEGERFHVEHPLRERLGGALHRCRLHRYLTELGGPPRQPGTYRVRWQDSTSDSTFEAIPPRPNTRGGG